MTAPALTTYANGVGQLSDDQLNTFAQSCDNFAQLRNFTGVKGVLVFSRGQTNPNDGNGGEFWWNPTNTAADDNLNVIVPNGVTLGGWNRISLGFLSILYSGALTCLPYPLTVPTRAGINVQGTTTANATSEAGITTSLNSIHTGNKVALYAGIQAGTNSGPVWSANFYTQFLQTAPNVAGFGLEIDINNSSTHNDLGGAINISGGGAGTAPGTGICGAAIEILGSSSDSSGAGWEVGIDVGPSVVKTATFRDRSSSLAGVAIEGNNAVGINLSGGTFSNSAILLPNNSPIAWEGTAGEVYALNLDASNDFVLGFGATAGTYIVGPVFSPYNTNVTSLGDALHLWTEVWATNGTIQTSDPTLKTDIAPVSSDVALKLLDAIKPITFRWKDGGVDWVSAPVTETVQATAPVTETVSKVQVVNGAAVQTSTPVTRQKPVYDHLPVVDSSGAPVMVTTPAKPEHRDKAGKLLRPAIPERTRQKTHRVPRMVTQTVTKKVAKPRAGRRTHWGWDASQIGAAFAAQGVDFGGYVKAEDGSLHMRPDQLVPVLWAAVQELAAKVAALEAKAP